MDTLDFDAEYQQHTDRTKAVGNALGVSAEDDGGGAYLRLATRPTGNAVIAYSLSPSDVVASDTDHWRVQDDDSGKVVMSDLPADTPAEQVAAWIAATLGAMNI